MTRHYLVCIAGLSQDLVERFRAVSVKRIAPFGHVIVKPYSAGGYSSSLASTFAAAAAAWIREQKEATPISVLLLYVDHAGAATAAFVDRFFPFALAMPIAPLDLSGATDKRSMNGAYTAFIEGLVETAIRGRRVADAVSHKLKDEHRTPLLLPVRNFQSREFRELLSTTYSAVGAAEDVAALVDERFGRFADQAMRKLPDDTKRCFSDGELYFVGPGKNRHGYFRHNSKGHQAECVLSARSRLGGSFAFDFHYDCQPVRKLNAGYPNCHGDSASPKPTHVNIAPNDFVI